MNHHALHRLFSFFYTLSVMDKLYVIFMTIKKMPIGRKHSAGCLLV